MTEHLGGPESGEGIAGRHRRYVADPRQFRVCEPEHGAAIGWVGYWERDWHGPVWEAGWAIVPEQQGRGYGVSATRAVLARAIADGPRRPIHAFPAVTNAASNAICRSAGFTLLGPCDFEFPPGHPLRCNDWRYDLGAG
jgi:RimJ/RimL family protein N-acetyltransferase